MEGEIPRLGGSLEVPNVQELAKESLSTVPPRYVRRDQVPLAPTNRSSLREIPIINMQNFLDENSFDSELVKLHNACQEWGFFQLTNHGVESTVVEKIKLKIEKFFNLPLEEKKKFSKEPGDVDGYEQAFVLSDEQKLDWADMFYAVTLPTYLRKPHLIPKFAPAFRNLEIVVIYLYTGSNILFEEGMQSMRMNYYPPCPQPELATGFCAHSDPVALTILLQVNEMQGLQIKKDGTWIPVVPLPDAFIINIGDIMEIVTNGTYQSIEHQATVNAIKERLSIATFFSPRLDGELGPSPSLVAPGTLPKFKNISVADYFRGFFAREIESKSYLDTMRI